MKEIRTMGHNNNLIERERISNMKQLQLPVPPKNSSFGPGWEIGDSFLSGGS